MGGILGRRPGSLGPQRRDLPPAGPPLRFSREKLEPLGDPAFQGEHNRNVFGELGLSEAEIDGYVASGALVSAAVLATVG
jgi:crotonobetainyl-CoA:carnitine CoA-transferase CaiB-like acyl-CoA transferase